MKTLTEVVVAVGRIERIELQRWVELGWITPARSAEREADLLFSDVDEARVRMICDLRRDLSVDEEGVALVLSLLDQVYALRHQVNALTDAVRQQPADVREAILERLRTPPSRNDRR